METTLTAGQEITLYSGVRGAEQAIVDSVTTVVTFHYVGSTESHVALYSVLLAGTNPQLAMAANMVEQRRSF